MSATKSIPSPPTPLPQVKKEAVVITPRHYQALCGLALATIFLVQIQRPSMEMPITLLVNLLVVFVGTLGILYRVRLSPILILIVFAVPHLAEQLLTDQIFNPDFRSFRFLDVADVLLCIAMLTCLIGQYRLHGLWFGVLSADPRQPAAAQARSEASLSASELLALIFPVPIFALLAEFVALLLKQHWTLIDLPPRWQQFLAVAWAILLALFLAAHAFRYWRRQQMDRVSAQVLLQDVLWHETRGEQRRINRWLVWKKLRR